MGEHLKPNIKGKYGNINDDGNPGSFAQLFKLEDPRFWDSIEEGIKPLVAALTDVGLHTFSSCEGHHYLKEAVEKYGLTSDYSSANCSFFLQGSEAERIVSIFNNYPNTRTSSFSNSLGDTFPFGDTIFSICFLTFPSVENRETLNAEIIKLAKLVRGTEG